MMWGWRPGTMKVQAWYMSLWESLALDLFCHLVMRMCWISHNCHNHQSPTINVNMGRNKPLAQETVGLCLQSSQQEKKSMQSLFLMQSVHSWVVWLTPSPGAVLVHWEQQWLRVWQQRRKTPTVFSVLRVFTHVYVHCLYLLPAQ